MSDLKLSAIGAACGGGLMLAITELQDAAADGLTFTEWLVAISQLQDAASDGLTFTEWMVGILAGIAVGGATGRVGYLALRWVGRRYFGDEDDE